MRGSAVIWLSLAVGFSGCASPGLNPAQQRAEAAFKDCQRTAATAQLNELREDGNMSFTARPGDYQRMIQCLTEKHGYKFQ
jgi:hypothetical protein